MTRILAALAVALSCGCIRPPEVVMVDRATALEQQASGSFRDLERQLNQKSIEARPVPLTPKQLQALGIRPAPLVDSAELTDADRVDQLLVQRCVGEGREGLLVDTHAACLGAADASEALELVIRVNQAREQLWRWMQARRPDLPLPALRRAWREVHAQGVVCGGWMEAEDGSWRPKPC